MFATTSFGDFMKEGGWGMWPVMLLGLVALASPTPYSIRPQRLLHRNVALLWVTLMVFFECFSMLLFWFLVDFV